MIIFRHSDGRCQRKHRQKVHPWKRPENEDHAGREELFDAFDLDVKEESTAKCYFIMCINVLLYAALSLAAILFPTDTPEQYYCYGPEVKKATEEMTEFYIDLSKQVKNPSLNGAYRGVKPLSELGAAGERMLKKFLRKRREEGDDPVRKTSYGFFDPDVSCAIEENGEISTQAVQEIAAWKESMKKAA